MRRCKYLRKKLLLRAAADPALRAALGRDRGAMSLLVHKRTIERAVLGELAPRDDARLRAHLRAAARAAGTTTTGSRAPPRRSGAAARRRRARRAAVRGAGRARAQRGRPHRRTIIRCARPASSPRLHLARRRARAGARGGPGAPLAVEGAGNGAGWRRQDTLRGGGASEAPPPGDGRPLRARKTDRPVSRAFGWSGSCPARAKRASRWATTWPSGCAACARRPTCASSAVDEQGHVHDYVADMAVAPGARPLTLGRSIEVSRGHEPGRLRLVALFSETEDRRRSGARRDRPPRRPAHGSGPDERRGDQPGHGARGDCTDDQRRAPRSPLLAALATTRPRGRARPRQRPAGGDIYAGDRRLQRRPRRGGAARRCASLTTTPCASRCCCSGFARRAPTALGVACSPASTTRPGAG